MLFKSEERTNLAKTSQSSLILIVIWIDSGTELLKAILMDNICRSLSFFSCVVFVFMLLVYHLHFVENTKKWYYTKKWKENCIKFHDIKKLNQFSILLHMYFIILSPVVVILKRIEKNGFEKRIETSLAFELIKWR